MNSKFPWLLIAGLALPLAAQASPIYRCTGGQYVAYQSYPCPEGMHEALVIPANSPPVMELQIPGMMKSAARPNAVGREEGLSPSERDGLVPNDNARSSRQENRSPSREDGRSAGANASNSGRPVFQ